MNLPERSYKETLVNMAPAGSFSASMTEKVDVEVVVVKTPSPAEEASEDVSSETDGEENSNSSDEELAMDECENEINQ